MIRFDKVTHSYGGGNILEDLDLELAPGSFHFLTGPSGAGKTTLLRLASGELQPTRGAVRVLGRELATLDRDAIARMRRRIGIIHQDCRLRDHLTIRENIALPLDIAGEDLDERASHVDELIAWVGLAHRQDARPPELSGGERQRAALARAVILAPEIVLADEPTGNIDWEMSLKILRLLAQLNRGGVTVLFATHDLALIRAAKNEVQARTLRLKGGQIQIAGAEL